MALIYNCDAIVEMRQERPCEGLCTNNEGGDMMPSEDVETDQYGRGRVNLRNSGRLTAADCRLGEWGEWSPCNATCGAGFRTRKRELLDRNVDDECLVSYFFVS